MYATIIDVHSIICSLLPLRYYFSCSLVAIMCAAVVMRRSMIRSSYRWDATVVCTELEARPWVCLDSCRSARAFMFAWSGWSERLSTSYEGRQPPMHLKGNMILSIITTFNVRASGSMRSSESMNGSSRFCSFSLASFHFGKSVGRDVFGFVKASLYERHRQPKVHSTRTVVYRMLCLNFPCHDDSDHVQCCHQITDRPCAVIWPQPQPYWFMSLRPHRVHAGILSIHIQVIGILYISSPWLDILFWWWVYCHLVFSMQEL